VADRQYNQDDDDLDYNTAKMTSSACLMLPPPPKSIVSNGNTMTSHMCGECNTNFAVGELLFENVHRCSSTNLVRRKPEELHWQW